MHRIRVLPRSFQAAMAAFLLLGLVLAAPVSASKPVPTATATLADRLCEILVGYNWTKFSGRNLVATVGLYERTVSGDVAISEQSFPDEIGRVGAESFAVSLTADQAPGGRDLVVIGSLTDTKSGQEVAGSRDESDIVNSTCG
jgi:hypothetical protein